MTLKQYQNIKRDLYKVQERLHDAGLFSCADQVQITVDMLDMNYTVQGMNNRLNK